jgi:hypothetical protein
MQQLQKIVEALGIDCCINVLKREKDAVFLSNVWLRPYRLRQVYGENNIHGSLLTMVPSILRLNLELRPSGIGDRGFFAPTCF